MAQAESHNMRLISHDKLAGFGNVGEGMSMQLTARSAHSVAGA